MCTHSIAMLTSCRQSIPIKAKTAVSKSHSLQIPIKIDFFFVFQALCLKWLE